MSTRQITRSFAGVLILFTLTASLMAEPASQPTTPRSWGHAHNDYKHKRPLLDALSSGFVSVEVDVFPVDGELLVGHDRHELQPGRNLETLYLKPLVERIKNKRAEVLKDANTFNLLIDFKDDGGTAYALLNEKIKPPDPRWPQGQYPKNTLEPSGRHPGPSWKFFGPPLGHF